LKRVGIRLKVTTNGGPEPYFEALANPAKRLEHQLAQGGWISDYLGDNARQTILPQYDSRLHINNLSEYHNPAVNRLIDRALAEPDWDRRAAMWGQIDQRIMRDAPWCRWYGSGSRSSGPPGCTVGCTTPGRPGPTSPPCGWTPRAPDRAISPPSAQGGPAARGDCSQQLAGGVPAATCPGRLPPRHRSALLTALVHRVVRVRPVLGDRRVVAGARTAAAGGRPQGRP
jgi:hypothetical protein